MPSVGELLRDAERVLKASEAVDHPHRGKERFDAVELLEFVLGHEPEEDDEVPAEDLRRFRRLLARRASGVPVGYLTGRTRFRGLVLEVGRGAFIPRQSSEFLAEQAIRRLRGRREQVHVDLATGVGPVALAVATALPTARVYGVDLFSRPISLARRNASRLTLRNATFLQGDLFSPLPPSLLGSVDTISIHPPYLGRRELRDLPTEIVGFEPRESLTDASATGMALLERVVGEAWRWLRRGGWLLVEVSPDRSRTVGRTLRAAGLEGVRSTVGEVAVSRVVVGRRSAAPAA